MTSAAPHSVVLYGRVSQVRDERSKSVDDQLAELRRWAEREGWPVYAERRDDNVSASRFAAGRERPGWEQVMGDPATGVPRALLAWEFSRNTRDPRVYAALEEACRTYRVQLGYSGRLHDVTTADGGFSVGLDALLAAKESALTSERTKRAADKRAERGAPHGSVTYGYVRLIEPRSGRVIGREIDAPPEAEEEPRGEEVRPGSVVRAIVRRLLGGEAATSIAADLNRRGVPAPAAGRCRSSCPCRKLKGDERDEYKGEHILVSGQWTGANLAKLALRPAYAGKREQNGVVLDGVSATWEPLITAEDHDRLRAIFADPTRDKYRNGTRVKNLGAGLFLCGRAECVAARAQNPLASVGRMRVTTGRDGAYACRTCCKVSRRKAPVDDLVERVIIERLSRPDLLDVLAGPDRADERAQARERVAALRAEEGDMRALLASGDLTPADMAAWRKGWRSRLDEAETLAAPPSVPGAVTELAGPDAAQRWARTSIEQRRTALDLLMRVTILPVGKATRVFDPASVQVEWRDNE